MNIYLNTIKNYIIQNKSSIKHSDLRDLSNYLKVRNLEGSNSIHCSTLHIFLTRNSCIMRPSESRSIHRFLSLLTLIKSPTNSNTYELPKESFQE